VFTIVHEAIGGCSEALGKDKSDILIRLACVFVVNDKLVYALEVLRVANH
jgi:hypothetical protein